MIVYVIYARTPTRASMQSLELKSLPDPRRTARNLRLIQEARTARGEAYTWSEQLEQALLAKAKS